MRSKDAIVPAEDIIQRMGRICEDIPKDAVFADKEFQLAGTWEKYPGRERSRFGIRYDGENSGNFMETGWISGWNGSVKDVCSGRWPGRIWQ